MSDLVTKISDNQWITKVQQDADEEDLFLQLPEELMEKMGWEIGDELEWILDGSTWLIQKKK